MASQLSLLEELNELTANADLRGFDLEGIGPVEPGEIVHGKAPENVLRLYVAAIEADSEVVNYLRTEHGIDLETSDIRTIMEVASRVPEDEQQVVMKHVAHLRSMSERLRELFWDSVTRIYELDEKLGMGIRDGGQIVAFKRPERRGHTLFVDLGGLGGMDELMRRFGITRPDDDAEAAE